MRHACRPWPTIIRKERFPKISTRSIHVYALVFNKNLSDARVQEVMLELFATVWRYDNLIMHLLTE